MVPTGQGVERLFPEGMGSAAPQLLCKSFRGATQISLSSTLCERGGTFRHSFYIIVHKSHLVAF